MNTDAVQIRSYQPGDDDAVYDICWQTGPADDDGKPIFGDRRLLGEIYVGPYLALEPSLAFVAEDDAGVAGYVLGALDTPAFEAACERHWWPEKRQQYLESAFPPSAPEQRLVRLLKNPRAASAALTETYPSHLHIDLLPRLQGRGCGRRLMSQLFRALRDAGSTGVHLGVGRNNRNAIGFYEHLGFGTVSRSEHGLTMALTLTDADDAS